ncbi:MULTISPECIES: Arm DNA-binding domain-containing protein [unclassified Ruegeria]|uniref:Arm DNA-binding domain-containing protein n=1 Tax=unclassified Ruegeria TaxID=2625375 RepID=UPI00148841D6|nr:MULTISPECIES: Arm DNA-binding domain-containing protein [unclassified Ruegeria]
MSKLTDPKVKAAKPGAKKIKMADGNGLTLIVHPKGSKTWVLRYRAHGKAKEMTLGTYPATTLKDARERALEQRSILQDGKDPVREEAREKVREQLVANDLFETIAKAFIIKRTKWSDGHRDRFVHRMEKDGQQFARQVVEGVLVRH